MLISPINTVNSTNFRANIKPTTSLKEGFELIEKDSESIIMKDMNYVKDFLDGVARISESKKIDNFKIDIDKRRPDYTYTKINGRRVYGGPNEKINNIQDAYLVVEGTKKYAENLEEIEPSLLDFMKAEIEEAQMKLDELKQRYNDRLKAELQQAKKVIFNNAK